MEPRKLENAYYISQLIVAVSVVLSLVFLSFQIRQNTLSIQGQSIATATLISQGELAVNMSIVLPT